ncbi:MAG: 23S rRNA (pseudouridine(1915)-N(3))-methyltransferase RlmH [Clostridia bacterium]
MEIKIIAIGNIKEKYLKQGINNNLSKLQSKFTVQIIEINEYKLPQNPSDTEIKKGLEIEGAKIKDHIDKDSYLIVCDINGKVFSSSHFKKILTNQLYNYRKNITFIIGGSFGLDKSVLRKANLKLSFGKMTFPHQLMRLILIEQLTLLLI